MAEYAPLFTENGSVLPKGTRIPMQQRFRQYANEDGLAVTDALITALLGVAAGATASRSKTRIKNNASAASDNGGKRQTEVYQPINRATTSADITALTALFNNVRRAPTTYPKDLSGNGGPSYTPG